jgi:hypothetical protein
MPFFTDQRTLHKSIGGKDDASILIAPILFDGENLNDKIPLQQKPRFSIILSVQLSVLVMDAPGIRKAAVVKENFALHAPRCTPRMVAGDPFVTIEAFCGQVPHHGSAAIALLILVQEAYFLRLRWNGNLLSMFHAIRRWKAC